MSILDAAEKHFASLRVLKEVKVEKWGGSVFYYDPPSIAERNKVLEYYDAAKDRFSPDALIAMFMVRARKEDGTPMFSRAGWDESFKRVSNNYDPDVVQYICNEMGGIISVFGRVKPEEAEKN